MGSKTSEPKSSTEQSENLNRVSERIGGLVLAFCAEAVRTSHAVFCMEELREYVYQQQLGHIAPDSPGRILRMLRREKRLDYTVLSRSQSLYEITFIEEKQ